MRKNIVIFLLALVVPIIIGVIIGLALHFTYLQALVFGLALALLVQFVVGYFELHDLSLASFPYVPITVYCAFLVALYLSFFRNPTGGPVGTPAIDYPYEGMPRIASIIVVVLISLPFGVFSVISAAERMGKR
jgi:hypothetical protein